MIDRGRPIRKEGAVKPAQPASGLPARKEAFATLPLGVPPSDAASKLPKAELQSLQRQAIGQAEHFEVLNHKDVRTLTRVCAPAASVFYSL
jgi:hypothetical protein